MGHFQLREDGSSTMAEQLELSGSKSFYVSPNSKNETQAPIRGSAIVSILGKNYSIQLTHKAKEDPDPEPSSTKWSYIENMYVTGNTPVATADVKNQDTAYVRASRGQTLYITNSSIITKLFVSKSYTQYQNLLDTVGDFSGTTYATQYAKGDVMQLITFTMYYKYSTESEGTVIPPVDDDTPASNKARIPCRPDVSSAPDWISDVSILYKVDYTHSSTGSGTRSFNTWAEFISFWDSIQTNPAYTDAVFHYILRGTVLFNELLNQRGSYGITISEINNGKGIGIHGAKPLYLSISQQEGKTLYGISMVPATANMLDTGYGKWFFDDLTNYEMSANRLSKYSAGTYNLRPKFRIQSANKAFNIATVTGGSMITNPDGAGTVSYQYIGQPFILKVFKETANGIEKNYLRPYYKQTGTSQNTSLWKTDVNLMGAQNFNPLQYDSHSEFYYLHVRNSGYRGFLSGPMSGNYGLAIFQLIPMSLYPMFGVNPYTVNDDIDGEGGVGTKGVNYVNRYNRYQSAMGSVSNDDKYKAAFLKWPNEDDNNNPDHISPGVVESLLSKMGKNWENSYQNNSNYSIVDRVMMVPVLWTETRLEDSSDFRTALSNNNPGFGHYLFSPYAPDSDLDDSRIDSVYRIHINGLDIQIQ